MASDIETYLKELQAALAGADPALAQDAVFDAEEHLQAELAAGRDFAEIVNDYGTPGEVAAAYLETSEEAGARPIVAPQAATAPAASAGLPPVAPRPRSRRRPLPIRACGNRYSASSTTPGSGSPFST